MTGRGRPCITARKRAAVNGTGAKRTGAVTIGGSGKPTGFMVRPWLMGAISGGDDLKLWSARTWNNCRPAAGSPSDARAWLKGPPPLNTIPAALKAVRPVTPAVIAARLSAALPKACRPPMIVGVSVAKGSGRLSPASISVLIGMAALPFFRTA